MHVFEKNQKMKRQGSVLQDTKFKKTKKPAYKRQSAGVGVSLAPELKYHDTSFNTDATTTGTIVSLSSVAAGDTALLRDGNKISVRSFELRIALENEALSQNTIARFLLVRDRNANASAITGVNLVLDTVTPQSLRLIPNLSRYDVLMDKTIVINNTSDTANCYQKAFFKKYVKIPTEDSLICYADGSAGVPITNSYSLLYLSDVASGVTDLNVLGQCRMRFVG